MKLNLEGNWKVALDRAEVGLEQGWQDRPLVSEDCIMLPASLNELGLGDIPSLDTQWTGSIYDRSWFHDPELEKYRNATPPHFPFWLTPRAYYVGVAWYEREVLIPEEAVGVPFRIRLERPHWQTRVWIEGESIGEHNSLSVPHVFEHPGVLRPGVHRVTLRVDNAIRNINPGQDAHSITDHTQGNWNGVAGRMELEFLPTVELRSVQLHCDFSANILHVRGMLSGLGAIKGNLSIQLRNSCETDAGMEKVPGDDAVLQSVQTCVATQSIYHEFDLQLSLDGLQRWDEFRPVLYQITVLFRASDGAESVWRETHGFREFGTQGTRFCVNGRRLFLRGNVDCCVFPKTGYAPMSLADWEAYYLQLKASGFNHVRFHSWCPPKAAFHAADKVGFYLQAEAPTWPNHGVSIGEGEPVDEYIYRETERILEQYGNHASLCMVASGNEPYGKRQVEFLGAYVQHWKARDARQLYTGASVGTKWPIVKKSEFIVHAEPRGLPFERELPHSAFDYNTPIAGYDIPFVSHEMGQFCVFPDFDELPRYTGVFRAKNLEMFRERFLRQFSTDDAEAFFAASGKLQLLCYKAEIEAALRTQALAGIQLLGANDFPGQGTALIGWLNAFYECKSYVNYPYLQRFLAPTVILGRTGKFVYDCSELMRWTLEVAHFGSEQSLHGTLEWQLVQAGTGEIYREGSLPVYGAASGEVSVVGQVEIFLQGLPTPARYTFRVRLGESHNEWDTWVYPEIQIGERISSGKVKVVKEWSDSEVSKLVDSGEDILLLTGRQIENGKDVVQYFRPAFWNTSWFQMAPPHTLGLHVDSQHPVFRDFPTEFHSDYQWWELVQGQPVANLEFFPNPLKPMVRPIDTWFINRRLGLLFEFRIKNSRFVFCTADLTDEKPGAAAQLYRSILNYMQQDHFNPEVEIAFETLAELFLCKPRRSYDVMTDEKPDELIPEIEG